MSDLIVAAIKIAFLALLWLFILFVANVVKHVPKHAVKALRAFGIAEYKAAETK